MKRMLAILLVMLLILTGCAGAEEAPVKPSETVQPQTPAATEPAMPEASFESRFNDETLIELSDTGIMTKALSVFTSAETM